MISQNFNSWLDYIHAIQGSGVMMHPVEGEEVTPVEPEPEPKPEPEPENPEEEETEEPEPAVETQTVKKTSKSKITE